MLVSAIVAIGLLHESLYVRPDSPNPFVTRMIHAYSPRWSGDTRFASGSRSDEFWGPRESAAGRVSGAPDFQKSGPAFPAFTSQEFQSAVQAVEQRLAASDFEGAKVAAELLPKRNFKTLFDDRKVPSADRELFRASCREALTSWGADTGIEAAAPDLKISFADSLAEDTTLGGPANIAVFYSHTPGQPRLSAVIGLHRGKDARPATRKDVLNDVRFAIGTYIGLGTHPFERYLMDPSARDDTVRPVWPVEHTAALGALDLADQLRRAVAAKQDIGISTAPTATIGPAAFEGDANQGDQIEVPIQLSNDGPGILVVNAVGDCSCVIPESAPNLARGEKGTLQVRIDTRMLSGSVDREVIVMTNDPGHPMFRSKVHLEVSPRYRVIMPGGSTWILGDDGGESDAYLVLGKGVESKLIDARVIGMDGVKVTWTPWKGSLPDPEANEPSLPRNGYKVHIKITGSVMPGRIPMALNFFTDEIEHPNFTQTIYLQRGIIALPEQLLMDVGAKPKTIPVLLSRPGRPFQVLSATSTIPSVKVTTQPGNRPGEVKLQVNYDGTAPKGDLAGTISVKTDDPKQPVVRIRLVGSVQ